MTDFFTRQEEARRRSGWLVMYFLAAVAGTVVAVYGALVLLFAPAGSWWHPRLFTGSAIGTLAVIAAGSVFRIVELSSGGGAVARSLGGRLVSPQTRDVAERRLLNVVQEMSLASGVPVPQVYVLDEERGINAFAAGFSVNDAAIGVTRGCLEWLNRDELQGVIAHEFSHILNGDMRLNVRLIGLIAGIMGLVTIGSLLLRGTPRRGKGSGQVVLLGLALVAIGWIGALFGRMIQAAISRQREYLADAAAVQFTRLPEGLAGALKKIGALAQGSRVESPRAGEAAHLFFSRAVSAWFSTHPPLEARIRALDPSFDGVFPPLRKEGWAEAAREPAPAGAAGARRGARPPVAPIPAPQVLSLAGTTTREHLAHAAAVVEELPAAVAGAVAEPFGAAALVLALVLDERPEVQQRQLEALARKVGRPMAEEARRLREVVAGLAPSYKLPLVDLAGPALRELSREQYQNFTRSLQELIEADQRLDLFEFALQKVVRRHLEPHFEPPRRRVVQYYSHKGLAAEIGLLLSALAQVGQREGRAVQAAFQNGVALLAEQGVYIPFFAWEQCHAEALDRALDACLAAAPGVRQRILNAMVATVTADGVVQPAEAELLRAFADALECPLPPLLGGVA
ncbi:MAG: M48 family metallopeptidase [Verrucomicrobiae bacterium]|nr:M48 family metallopeptidase [Verrucomicrobiae bacterium]